MKKGKTKMAELSVPCPVCVLGELVTKPEFKCLSCDTEYCRKCYGIKKTDIIGAFEKVGGCHCGDGWNKENGEK